MKNQSFVLIGITILLVFGVPGIESDVFCQLGLPSGSQIPVSSGSVTEINGQVLFLLFLSSFSSFFWTLLLSCSQLTFLF